MTNPSSTTEIVLFFIKNNGNNGYENGMNPLPSCQVGWSGQMGRQAAVNHAGSVSDRMFHLYVVGRIFVLCLPR